MKLTPLNDGHAFMKTFVVVDLFYTGAIKSTSEIHDGSNLFTCLSNKLSSVTCSSPFNSFKPCCRLHIYVCGHIDDPPMLK